MCRPSAAVAEWGMMRNDVRHCSFLFFVIHASLVSTHRYSGIQTETRADLFLKRWVDLRNNRRGIRVFRSRRCSGVAVHHRRNTYARIARVGRADPHAALDDMKEERP